MSLLAVTFRQRADEKRKASETLLEASDFIADAKKQALFVVGQVSANTLNALADMVEYLEGVGSIDAKQAQRDTLLEKSNAIRTAAAAGNWERFDSLVDSFGGSGSDGT